MKVVFPRPDSPATYKQTISRIYSVDLETPMNTIIVNAAPRFATILCLGLCESFARRSVTVEEFTSDLEATSDHLSVDPLTWIVRGKENSRWQCQLAMRPQMLLAPYCSFSWVGTALIDKFTSEVQWQSLRQKISLPFIKDENRPQT